MNKKNILYLVILAVLILVVWLSQDRDKEVIVGFFGVDSSDVFKVEIADSSDTVIVARTNLGWNVTYPVDFPADMSKINSLFEKIINANCSSVPVSEAEDAQHIYEVSDSLGTLVSLFGKNDKSIGQAYIGRSKDYNYSNARRVNEKAIYRLENSGIYYIKPTVKLWRKKEIATFAKEDIARINITFSDKNVSHIKDAGQTHSYSLIATDTLWTYSNSKSTFSIKENDKILVKIISGLSKISSGNYIDDQWDEYKEAFESPKLAVEVIKKNGESADLKIAIVDGKSYLKYEDQTSTLFEMPTTWYGRFTKFANDFNN